MAKLELREGSDPFIVTHLKMRDSSQVFCVWSSFGKLGDQGCVILVLTQSMTERSTKHCTQSIETTNMNTIESLPSESLKFTRDMTTHIEK